MSKEPSAQIEPDPVAVAGWLEVDRLARKVRDLEGRAQRTLDYTDSLLRLPDLNPQLGEVLRAIHNSLCTPTPREPSAQVAEAASVEPFRPDPALRTVDVLPPRETGWWGPETVVCNGIRYSRLHGGTWIERDMWCDWSWGDFGCAKRAHGPEVPHRQTFWHDLSETRVALIAEQGASDV